MAILRIWTLWAVTPKIGENVVQSDSSYLVLGVNEWIPKWKENGYRDAENKPVVNAELFKRLDELMTMFASMKWEVKFKHVPRSLNEKADELADRPLDSLNPSKTSPDGNAWIVSNMTSFHMCSSRAAFSEFSPVFPQGISTHAGKDSLYSIGEGTVELEVVLQNEASKTLRLEGVLYVPGLMLNLFSPSGYHFDWGTGTLSRTGESVARAPSIDNLYVVQLKNGPQALYPPGTPKENRHTLMASAWVTGSLGQPRVQEMIVPVQTRLHP